MFTKASLNIMKAIYHPDPKYYDIEEKNEARLENFHRRYKSHPEVSEIIEKYRRRKKSGPQS